MPVAAYSNAEQLRAKATEAPGVPPHGAESGMLGYSQPALGYSRKGRA
ncbi:hypothetical protein ISF6_0818 [Piscinibacter sakaiensis]|uniref:Uncharacterized protein n=1 Tax=Piscinibacter sakaiensis TaxID=1547922 RepID=A0A0K8NXV1_PISS1|nr:hypothetical protein ISF6_0818 [Piscinibacter sakaiensis]